MEINNDGGCVIVASGERVSLKSSDVKLCTSCLICGESVELDDCEAFTLRVTAKVCPACKEAVMVMRQKMEENKCSKNS